MIFSGDQTGKIFGNLPIEDNASGEIIEPLDFLVGHESNVCALDSKHGIVISGSWDKTARVWEDKKVKHILKGHSQAVWCVAVLSKSLVLTGSADKTIRLWKDGVCKRVFKGHTDAVRGIDILSDSTFVTCSNDASIRVWSIDTEDSILEFYGHTSFIYSVKVLGNGDIISSGEDRSCRVWRNGECIQVITLPCVSLWSVAVDKATEDIAVGGSDHIIRVFTRNPTKYAPEAERKQLEETVASSGIGKDQMSAVNKEALSGPEGLSVEGKKEGEIKMIRSETDAVIAYQWSAGTWVKIGEVVGQGTSSSKKSYNGKDYDYVFDVDIEDGKPALKLPYNLTENPYDAARRFLESNELPASYLDQVAHFIIQNSESVDLSSQAPEADPYGTRYIPGATEIPAPTQPAKVVSTKVVPIRNYVQIVTFQPAPIVKAIKSFNAKQEPSAQLSAAELAETEISLAQINHISAQKLYAVVSKILNSWDVPSMLPAFDILRIIIPSLETFPPVVLVQQLLSCMDESIPKHCLLAIRGLVNLFVSPNSQALKLVDNATARDTAFGTITKLLATNNNTAASNIAIASLCLNYAILTAKKNSLAAAAAADSLLLQFVKFYPYLNDSESRYRLFLGVGTLLTVANPTGKKAIADFISSLPEMDLSEDRFKILAEDIQALVQ